MTEFIAGLVMTALVIVLGDFRNEVRGEPTIIGCYIRGAEGIEDGRCE